MNKLNKIIIEISVIFFFLINITFSQWYAVFDNENSNQISGFDMNYFNIRIGSFFEHVGTYGESRPFRLLVNTGPGTESQTYFSYGQTWNTHVNSNFYNIWQPNYGDRYYTVGTYYYPAPIGAPLTNLVFVMGGNNCKVIASPYDQNDTWEQVWSNNGNGYLGDPSWDISISACRFMTGNFATPYFLFRNNTGQQVFVWDNDGLAALLQFNYDINNNVGSWTRLWWNNYSSKIGPWFQPGEFTDRFEAGDFDGDNKDEIIVYNPSSTAGYQTYKRAMLLKYSNNTWSAIWDNNKNGMIGGWQIPLGDLGYYMYAGDFSYNSNENKHEVMFVNKNTQLVTLEQYTGIGSGWDRLYNANSFSGIQNFSVSNNDNYYAGNYNFDGGRKEELFHINYNNGDAKILQYQQNYAGCPWIWVYESDTTGFQADNNILHRSEFNEYYGIDIVDKYKLKIKPQAFENMFFIRVAETENDYNYFDNFRLMAVDHPVGTEIGITESNDIIMYDVNSVVSSEYANLNGIYNITNSIQYDGNGKKVVTGTETDSIFAYYSSGEQLKSLKYLKSKYSVNNLGSTIDSFALFGEIGGNSDRLWAKCPVADLVINTAGETYYRQIARRESYSDVIIPFAGINDECASDVNINWNSDFALTYFSVVPIMYSGFYVNDLELVEANHSIQGDVISLLNFEDNYYSELDSNGYITLKFNDISTVAEGFVRDYVLETKGRYLTTLSEYEKLPQSTDQNLCPDGFKLYTNFPNPFNPATLIKYDLPKDVKVTIRIYDLLGREVATLLNNEFKYAGRYELTWNASNYATGVYIYRIEAGEFVSTKKMVLIK